MLIGLILSFGLGLQTSPNTSALETFRQGLKADLSVLREAYTAMHPGLYRYNTPAEMARNFEVLGLGFSKARDRKDAFLRLSEFTAKVRCGHTYPNFFNQHKDVVAEVFAGKTRLPFHFVWIKEKMVVTEDLTPNHIAPKGSQIDAINGVSTGVILRKLLKVARADGSNDAKRRTILEVDGTSKWEAFDIYYPLYFPLSHSGKRPTLNVDITLPNGKWVEKELEPLTMEDRFKDRSQTKEEVTGDVPWTFDLIQGNVRLLKMPTWALFNSKFDWVPYLDKVFAALTAANAPGLIVDLRGNEGGNDVGDEILAHLVKQPTSFGAYRSFVRSKKVPPALRPYLDTWDRSFDDWSPWCQAAEYVAGGNQEFFPMTRFEDGTAQTIIQPKGPFFNGKLVVLVDGTNSSATGQFDAKVREAKLGTLIGQPTGGNLRGINGGAFYFLYLPNSGLEVDLPLVGQFPNHPQPDGGLAPDILVMPTRQDIARGRDATMEAALTFLGVR